MWLQKRPFCFGHPRILARHRRTHRFSSGVPSASPDLGFTTKIVQNWPFLAGTGAPQRDFASLSQILIVHQNCKEDGLDGFLTSSRKIFPAHGTIEIIPSIHESLFEFASSGFLFGSNAVTTSQAIKGDVAQSGQESSFV